MCAAVVVQPAWPEALGAVFHSEPEPGLLPQPLRRPGVPRSLRVSATTDAVPDLLVDFLPPTSNGGAGEQQVVPQHCTQRSALHSALHHQLMPWLIWVGRSASVRSPRHASHAVPRFRWLALSLCAAINAYLVRGTSPGRPNIEQLGLPAPLADNRVCELGLLR